MDRVQASVPTELPVTRNECEPRNRAKPAGSDPCRLSGDVAVPATILVVEDEQIVALELAHRLTRLGHSVVGVVASGEEAIEESRRLRPELVLMDIKLQGELDGIDAVEAIRRELDTAIVYLTAFADEATLERAKVTQPYGYIMKPFLERELHVVIEVSLYRRRAERALRESELWRLAVLRSVGDAVIASDASGRVRFMNPAAETLTGWSESEAIGVPMDEVFKTVQTPATSLIRRDGSECPIELELTPIRDVGTQEAPMGTVCVFRIGQLQRIPASVLVADALSSGEEIAAKHSIRLARSPLHDAEVLCDRGRIHQVLANLIGNAVKLSPEGSVIRIDAELGRGFLQVSVSDQGTGIAPDELDHVFELEHRGTGLYIAKRIVDAHGGHIWVYSTQGMGSTFHYTIPLAPRTVGCAPSGAWRAPA
jgi:signal transduction histidine kinase